MYCIGQKNALLQIKYHTASDGQVHCMVSFCLDVFFLGWGKNNALLQMKYHTLLNGQVNCMVFFVGRKLYKTKKKTAPLLYGKPHYIKESSELHDFLVGRKFSQMSFCECLSSFFMKERTASNRKPHCIRKSSELHDFFLLDVHFLEQVFVFFL